MRARLFRVLRSQGGFTLLELVIAMAILGLILAILGAALRISQNTILTGGRSMERTHRARVITEQISQELRSAYRPSQVGTSVETVAFRGEADRFSFVTTASMRSRGFVQSGLKEVTLSVEEDADTGRRGLVLREDIIPNGELFEEGKGQRIMLDPTVEAIKYRYFGPPPTTGGIPPPPRWEESWKSDTPPTAVEFLLTFKKPEKGRVMEIPPITLVLPIVQTMEREKK